MTTQAQYFQLQQVTADPNPRLIVHCSGLQGTGKSRFALTAPGPIYYVNIDRGVEGVAEQFIRQGKVIYETRPAIPSDATQVQYSEIWREFREFWAGLCRYEEGTVVLDTLTVITELSKNAHFGKTIEIPPNKAYVWQEPLRELVRMTHDSRMNAVFIQRRGDLWGSTPDPVTGLKPTDVRGFSSMPYEAQVSLELRENPAGIADPTQCRWWGIIDKCRQNATLQGRVIPDPSLGITEMDFEQLRRAVHGL